MSEPIAPPKKGLSTCAKIAIGCLVALLVVMGGCAIATYMGLSWLGGKAKSFAEDMEKNPDAVLVKTVEFALKLNPEVEVVSSDPKNGTITLREKKSGKVVTFNASISECASSSRRTGRRRGDFDQRREGGIYRRSRGKLVYEPRFGVDRPVPSYPEARQEGHTRSRLPARAVRCDPDPSRRWLLGSKSEEAGFEVEKSTLDISGVGDCQLNAGSGNRGVNIVVSSQEGETQKWSPTRRSPERPTPAAGTGAPGPQVAGRCSDDSVRVAVCPSCGRLVGCVTPPA
jgi:hypothetical protein